ncbi:hypothetical protein C5E11_14845 [Clavibacter michiganensis]|nr:hypothetical protein [Clavibacter michiganensis]PPF61590.1 hypothetical protein C5E11_14845 [Clavibacter michiganensis]
MIPTDANVHSALINARPAAQSQMASFEAAGATWHEEPMTELLLGAASPVVKFAQFTRQQEATVGADWLWWWIDDFGEAFGMLVQAKRLLHHRKGWDIDFDYKTGDQRRALVQTGLDLGVAPMYALYLGTSEWRSGAFCQDMPHRDPCSACERSTVSMVPAIVTDFAASHSTQVSTAMEVAMPIEFISDKEITANPVWDSNLSDLDMDLATFLFEPQKGARRVAQMIFQRVTKVRAMMFSGPTGVVVTRGAEPIFRNVPDDLGHFRRRYYPEILDGLRHEVPDYVLDVLSDQEVPENIRGRLAGVAIFHC